MHKILFVCHGNICRSPMAEFVLKDMVKKAGLENDFEIASVAVSREELGNPVYPPARQDVAYYECIYYMDRSNARYLSQMFPGETKFRPFLPRDVADPWYSGDFRQTWLDICEGCARILEEAK